MKKLVKGLISIVLCGSLAFGIAGCGNKPTPGPEEGGNDKPTEDYTPTIDTETRPLQLAIGSTDKKFNPMFYTAQNDGIIANMTQASLMTVDSEGKLAYGDDQPVVALDYLETYYDGEMRAIGYGFGDDKKTVGENDKDGYTTFEFVIKNGVKFSDGTPLTVSDVLFNLYIYLDPAYSGSSTIYSTKILGMQAYRKQDKTAQDGVLDSGNDKYADLADARWNNLYDWSTGDVKKEDLSAEAQENLDADYEWLLRKFKEEIETDWNSLESTWEDSYKDNYRFTEAWQAYYYREGVVKTQTAINNNGRPEEVYDEVTEGTITKKVYYTTLDPNQKEPNKGKVEAQEIIDGIEGYVTENLATYMAAHTDLTEAQAKLALQKEYAINHVYDAYAKQVGVQSILYRWAAGNDLYDYIISDERAKDFANKDEDERVYNISGISVYRSDKLENKKDALKTKSYGEEHDILKITIKGVDPKAKWNFSFAVAPMHYYSDAAHTKAAQDAYALGTAAGGVYSDSCKNFGVEFNNTNWLDNVVASGEKNKLPMGAGAYKATTWNHTGDPTGTTFYYNNIGYFERNTYFTTLGTGINNAKIKYVNYKELPDDKIIEALKTGEIDYGEPIAKASNVEEVGKDSKLEIIDYYTGGYGYVGINPAYVPVLEVRQAIMHAFDVSWIYEYYGTDYVNPIYWPVSTTSWAYPVDKKTRYYEQYTKTQEIIDLVEESGKYVYDASSNKMKNKDTNETLSLTFTIAGETSDHPAYSMFLAAEKFLERCGFEISVVTDVEALLKLATGKLEVWAAAWSSSIDPDPYQIYSKNSEATSTKNWNKDGILKNEGGKFDREKAIVDSLSQLIDEGRSTLNMDDRIDIYEECYEKIMQLAVEFPTYQRKDMCVYNKNVLNSNTFVENANHIMGPLDRIWKVNYV